MKLISSDQVNRLSGLSIIVDEVVRNEFPRVKSLGIGYMVGKKGKASPADIIQRCPRQMGTPRKVCGAMWKGGVSYRAGTPELECAKGHKLHLSVDDEEQHLTRHTPTFILSTWDKFVSQSFQRRLGLLFGAKRYFCPEHGIVDVADTTAVRRSRAKSSVTEEIKCNFYENDNPCRRAATPLSGIVPGLLVLDEGHLIRETEGTLDSHFETAYLELALSHTRKYPIVVLSTATIEAAREHLRQLGMLESGNPVILPNRDELGAFFENKFNDLKHEALAVMPFDVVLNWAAPHLIDIFFETFRKDYLFDVQKDDNEKCPEYLEHLRQVMIYSSSYKNINALAEMNKGAVRELRRRRVPPQDELQSIQLSRRYFDRVAAQRAIDDVKNIRQQIVYATNIASIGIDIENLDVIFFYGLPSNVSEFIQSLNRTGRRKPAICLAILGPNREREVSYFRYWPQFVLGSSALIEPVPLNRYAYTAIDKTFNNIAVILLLMKYLHKEGIKLYKANQILGFMRTRGGPIDSDNIVSTLKRIYRASEDPTGHYSEQVELLWKGFLSDLENHPNKSITSPTDIQNIFEDWLTSLRLIQQPVNIYYPEIGDFIDRVKSGAFISGDNDIASDLSTEEPDMGKSEA